MLQTTRAMRLCRATFATRDDVHDALRAHHIDTIVNFAAETHVDRSILDADAFLRTNVFGTFVLLEAAKQFGLERYHQISTDEVYGWVDKPAYETDPLIPRSPYAAAKASGDLMVNAYHVTHHVPTTITRASNTVGPYQYPEKVVPLFITNALENRAAAAVWRRQANSRLALCDRPLRGGGCGPAQGKIGRGL